MTINGYIYHDGSDRFGYPVQLPAPPDDPTGTQAVVSDHLRTFLGTVVHTEQTAPDPFSNLDNVIGWLTDLGISHVRERLQTGTAGTNQRARFARLFNEAGCKITSVLGTGVSTGNESVESLVSFLETASLDVWDNFEGPNEWNLSGRVNWAAELQVRQQALYTRLKASGVGWVAAKPMLAPSMGKRQGYNEVGDLSAYCDGGNLHIYQGGQRPSLRFDSNIISERNIVAGAKPIVVTESGYHNAMNVGPTEHIPTLEEACRYLQPKLLLETFLRGLDFGHPNGLLRCHMYELVDQKLDTGLVNREAHFGLVRFDLSLKPSYHSLRRLINLIKEPGASFSPTKLGFKFNNGPADLQCVTLQKSNFEFYLVVWRDVDCYDIVNHVMAPTSPQNFTLNLNRLANITVYKPTVWTGTSPSSIPSAISTAFSNQQAVSLGDDVMVIKVVPVGGA